MIFKKITIPALVSALAFANGVTADSGVEDSSYVSSTRTFYQNECQIHNPISVHSSKGKKIKLLQPQDQGFRSAMGGEPSELSMNTFHAAEGTMYILEKRNGSVDITFDFHGLLPLGVYSLWNVFNPNYQNDMFSDGPLEDQSGISNDVTPGRLGAPEGYGNHGFKANKCGSANFTIKLLEHPGTEFLLDFHSNGFQPGVKGETIFPGVLWGKFPEWTF